MTMKRLNAALAIATVALVAALPGPASAQATSKSLLSFDYDPDNTAYYCPALCTPISGSTISTCGGPGRTESRKITTSGAANTTVTGVATNSAFDRILPGDVIQFSVPSATGSTAQSVQYLRRVATKTSDSQITVNDTVTIPTAGVTFVWWKMTDTIATSEGGWWDFPKAQGSGETIVIDFNTISLTGGIDYKVECRHKYWDKVLAPVIMAGPTNVTTASVARVDIFEESYDQCRVCMKVGTSDVDAVTFTAGIKDIDWVEYADAFTTTNADNDLDFTEDPGGVPKACTVSLTNASNQTGAALCADVVAKMNAAACTPDNTYSCTFSNTTHEFTIARATGTKDFSLLWQTGANTATSVKTVMGFDNLDDTAAVTYTSDSAAGAFTYTTALTAGGYSPDAACVHVAAKMNATASIFGVYSCSYSPITDKITISVADGATTAVDELQLLWATGTNNATSADSALGFGADKTGAVTYDGAALGLTTGIEKVNISVQQHPID